MRRDPEYKKAYDEIKLIMADLADAEDSQRPKGETFQGKFKSFLERFGSLQDPSKNFDNVIKGSPGNALNALIDYPHYLREAFQMRSCNYSSPDKMPHLLEIFINFQKVNSREKLKKEVCKAIDSQWQIYKKLARRNRQRLNRSDYDRILHVGDLRTSGKTNQEIAKELYPEEFKNPEELENDEAREGNPESAIKRVSNDYQRFLRLSRGGYRKMTYP